MSKIAWKKSQKSNMNIQDLPADCVLLIFKHITLNDLLTCRQVCRHFHHMAHEYGKGVRTVRLLGMHKKFSDLNAYFSELHELNLQDNPEFKLDQTNTLVVGPQVHLTKYRLAMRLANGKKDYGTRFLASLLPNVQNLILSVLIDYGRTVFHMDHCYLLKNWRHTLKSLTLFGKFRYSEELGEKLYVQTVTDYVKQCVHLRELHLINFADFDLTKCPKLYDQLEALTCSHEHHLESYIQHYTAVKHLRANVTFKTGCIPWDRGLDKLRNVDQLSITCPEMDSVLFCSYFINLTHLDISVVHYLSDQKTTFEKLTKELAKLKKLAHLKLSSRLLLNDLHSRTPPYLATFPKLRHIRTLHLLDIERNLIQEFEPLHYEFVADKYPAVERLHISCPFNLHSRKTRTKIEDNFRKHFAPTRMVEIKFIKYTRFQDFYI